MYKFLLASLLGVCLSASAATSTVTGTVTDTDGQAWNLGNYTATLTIPNNLFNRDVPRIGGVPVYPAVIKGTMSATGFISGTFTDTSSVDQPGTKWVFQLCPRTSGSNVCVTVATTVIGATVNLTPAFSSLAAPRFPASGDAFGYADTEVQLPPPLGSRYFNVTDKCLHQWDGQVWTACNTSSGGLGPGGAIYEAQANPGAGPTNFIGNNLFSNAGKTILTTQSAFTALTTNGNTNTDLAGGIPAAIANCNSSPCNLETANGSTDATVMTQIQDGASSSQWTHIDHRQGLAFYTAQNPFAQSDSNLTPITPLGGTCNYGQTGNPAYSSGVSALICLSNNTFKIGGGISVDDHWTTVSGIGGQSWFNTRGQSYGISRNDYFMKAGDSIEDERTVKYRNNCNGFSDECAKFLAWHFQELGTQYGTIGTGSSARGGTTVTLNFGSESHGYIEDSAFLIDTDEPAAVQGYQFDTCVGSPDQIIPQLCHTTSSHAVSTWQATLLSACGSDDIRDSKVTNPTGHLASCSVNVTSVSAAPAIGSAVTIADTQKYESARVTAYTPSDNLTGTHTITLSLTLSHTNVGTLLMQGGTAGNIAVFAPPGSSDPSTAQSQVISAFPSGGSPDATHEYLVTNLLEGETGVQNIRFPVAPSESIGPAMMSCSGGVVSVANSTGGQLDMYLNIAPVGTQQWVVSGNSSASMNGVVTNVHMNSNGFGLTGSWTAPGGTCGSGIGTGGTITLTHSADVYEYCGAEVTANASGTTFQNFLRPSGLIHLDDNNCLFATGSRAMQPNRVESIATPYVDYAHGQTQALNGTGGWGSHEIGGMTYSGQYLHSWNTDNNVSCPGGDYYGCGGANLGNGIEAFYMPMDGWLFADGLIPGGVLFTINCPLIGCSSTMPDTPLFTLPNGGGIVWHGAGTQLQFTGAMLFENGWEAHQNTELDQAIQAIYQSYQGSPMIWGECHPFSAGEQWCWGTNPTSGSAQNGSIETGNVQVDVEHGLTGFNGTVQKPVCLSDGTDCPSSSGVASLSATNNYTGGATQNFVGPINNVPNTPAVSGTNQSSPNECYSAFYFNVSSLADKWCWVVVPSTGTNPSVTLQLNRTTASSGTGSVSLPFNVLVTSINASNSIAGTAVTGSSSVGAATTSPATSSTNFSSPPLQTVGAVWNGTVTTSDIWQWVGTLGAGTNGASTYTLSHSGSTGTSTVSMPYVVNLPTPATNTNNTQAATTAFVTGRTGISNTASAAVGTGVTSVTCATATCTNLRGSYTIVGGTATTGTIATLSWATTTTAYVCQVMQNGGASFYGIGHGVATATGMTITAGVTVASATVTVDYECTP